MKTIQELNKIMCEAMGVSVEAYDSMNLSEQFKLRQAYVKKHMNLKPRKSK